MQKRFSNSRPIPAITAVMVTEAGTTLELFALTKARTTDVAMVSPPHVASRRSISEKQARRVGSELVVSAVCHVPVIVPGLDRALTVLYLPVVARRVHPRPPHLAPAQRRARAQGRRPAASSTGRRPRHGQRQHW